MMKAKWDEMVNMKGHCLLKGVSGVLIMWGACRWKHDFFLVANPWLLFLVNWEERFVLPSLAATSWGENQVHKDFPKKEAVFFFFFSFVAAVVVLYINSLL